MRRRSWGATIALVLAALIALSGTATAAAPAGSIRISSVGGKTVAGQNVYAKLSGNVAVKGTSAMTATNTGPAPLVADAGASPAVRIGTPGVLLGSAWGGTPPYTYAWSSSVGDLKGADSPTAQLQTASATAPGTYVLTLSVADAAGAKATDTVKAFLYDASPRVLLDQTESDVVPGTFATDDPLEIPFEVPAGMDSMTATLSWTIEANDYDISLRDPAGNPVEITNGGAPETSESIDVASPMAGTWTFLAQDWATTIDDVTAHVEAIPHAADPLPQVSTAGPFKFLTGAAQKLGSTIIGGQAPYTTEWDVNEDGRSDATGPAPTISVADGRRLVTLRVTDARGYEARETTSVLVGDAKALKASTPITVIGLADSGINPYHLEFSAQTYPDPDVLALTKNFTRNPAEYIPGFPKDAKPLPITLGKGYFPQQDQALWDSVKGGKWYWIPGTKIIGAYSAGVSGSNVATDVRPILDEDGHGTGSASVTAGNRYGYCPTCLLAVVEALDESIISAQPWVDIQTNSFGYVGGAPLGPAVGANVATRNAVERGQTVLFAAGNGVGNAFDVPVATYGSDQTGNDWNITVGAIRRDNQRAIVGDGIPVHLSSWGDGDIPSACRTGTVSQCQHGGTSAATPYTAGIFGTVLNAIRGAIGDGDAGQKAGQVVARGVAIPDSPYLRDGTLTRSELREAVLKTAFPLNQDNNASIYPFPLTAPYSGDTNVLVEGYGAATPESAKRAIDVLLGRAALPERPFEDQFFQLDRQVRDTLYGGYDRDGDGVIDSYSLPAGTLDGMNVSKVLGSMKALRKTAEVTRGTVGRQTLGSDSLTYFLHRVVSREPSSTVECGAEHNELYMDTRDTNGDLEPCYEARVTTIAAAFRPVGVFASSVELDAPLPAGSHVAVTLYVAAENSTVIRPSGTLLATDREIGTAAGTAGPVIGTGTGPGSNAQGNELPDSGGCKAAGELCWTRFDIAFDTTRPAFSGENLTFQVSLVGTRAWAFGFEGAHASKVSIDPAPLPATGFEFGVTISSPAAGASPTQGSTLMAGGQVAFPDQGSDPTDAGDHPSVQKVQVSLDDATFFHPVKATIDSATGTWSAELGKATLGSHTLYARAVKDRTVSKVTSSAFSVGARSTVEWQIVRPGEAAKSGAWKAASGLSNWSFTFKSATYGHGKRVLLVRLVQGGMELARQAVTVRLS
ncbi:MAG: hypothetical protein QOH61_195 [Chloroflexota bacterium]|nr:hypothetical protein [Chloroflexota bacterium]